jgi:hypothetical protein
MTKKIFSAIVLSLFVLFVVNAQTYNSNEIQAGSLHKQQQLDSLLMLHKKVNSLQSSVAGYRIQIYFESGNYSKTKALEVKNMFEQDFFGIPAYVSFNEPYYRVRVGNFRTKIEAVGFLKQIQMAYANAFVVKDLISFEKFDKIVDK